MKSDDASGYEFTFAAGQIKESIFLELSIQIDDPAQDGW